MSDLQQHPAGLAAMGSSQSQSQPGADLVKHLGDDQKHLLHFWGELDAKQRADLSEQILSIDVEAAREAWTKSATTADLVGSADVEPVLPDCHVVAKGFSEWPACWTAGLDAVARGEVAAIVLAGGQASRLGADHPKGTLPLNLGGSVPGDSLLGLQAQKLVRLQQLAREAHPELAEKARIHWVVMTSIATEKDTRAHLDKILPAAGLSWDQVTLFSQSDIPAYDENGRFILSSKSHVFTAPDGNGGIFAALATHLPKLRNLGIKHFHAYCVDNILCRVADPAFIGFAVNRGADVAAKAVEKTDPNESVGVIARRGSRVCVLEYSELTTEQANQKEGDRLRFRAGSIANHYFSLEFLERVCTPDYKLPYHRASKKIAYVDETTGEVRKPEKPNGVKLEQFIFDVFEHKFCVWEVDRDEFAPLKNSDSTGKDCPSTCRRALLDQYTRWLNAVGARPHGDVWVSALRSYAGEALDELAGHDLNDGDIVD